MNHRLLLLNLSSKEEKKKRSHFIDEIFCIFRSDVKLYKDDIEIKFCKTLDSCKIPQVEKKMNVYFH
jgi:hypothetical protein